jgi:hypothetical protein
MRRDKHFFTRMESRVRATEQEARITALSFCHNDYLLLEFPSSQVATKDAELRRVKKSPMKRTRAARHAINALRMPEKTRNKEEEVFKVFVNPAEHLLVPVRRQLMSMPSREKELIDAGFVATSEMAGVHKAMCFWQNAIKVMQKHGIVNMRYVGHPKKKNKNIRAYNMATDFCIEPILEEIGGEEDEIEWLRAVTSSAGRVSKSQTRIDDYMRPKDISTRPSPPPPAAAPVDPLPETNAATTSPETAANVQEKETPPILTTQPAAMLFSIPWTVGPACTTNHTTVHVGHDLSTQRPILFLSQ